MFTLEQETQKKDLQTGFMREVLDKMRELTSIYVENYQTDLAVDVEVILTTDLKHFIWVGRQNGTCLACNCEQYDLYTNCFTDIRVKLFVDIDKQTMVVKRTIE